uniref:Exportin-1/Importin-beta-like domain-containing protein n=1 Tax=Macaca nemestrina TaxID=9545 RepID=A0A2K6D6V4_MACNE
MAPEEGIGSLLTGVFHNCTTDERKHEIEELLNNFYFLSSTRNDYVMMYSLTVFENLINKMWLGVPSQDEMEIHSCLPKLLVAPHKTLPSFIMNKLCKVIVDIGRQDWPMLYHDFFTNILQLNQSPVTTPLGRSCGYWTRCRHVTAATPPPSPTSGDLLSNLLQTPSSAELWNKPIPILDVVSQYICSLALECLAHLFSWIPLSASITPSLFTIIFHFVRFGYDIRARNMVSVNGSSQNCVWVQEWSQLGVLAMSCIKELMSKNCVPMEFEEYLLCMFQQTFYLLQKITKDNNAHTVKSRLEELDESYIEKELMRYIYKPI